MAQARITQTFADGDHLTVEVEADLLPDSLAELITQTLAIWNGVLPDTTTDAITEDDQ